MAAKKAVRKSAKKAPKKKAPTKAAKRSVAKSARGKLPVEIAAAVTPTKKPLKKVGAKLTIEQALRMAAESRSAQEADRRPHTFTKAIPPVTKKLVASLPGGVVMPQQPLPEEYDLAKPRRRD